MMDRSLIEKIEEMAGPASIEIDGRKFKRADYSPVRAAEADALKAHTLTGVVDFLTSGAEGKEVLVHVENHNRVFVRSFISGLERQRETLLDAEAYPVDHKFGKHLPVDEFIVYLQSTFTQDETTDTIIKIVSNLVTGAEAQYTDDGMTQRVEAKAGITRVEKIDLPNPVTLRPYRTFMDIEQPASRFVLRIKAAGDDKRPQVALFEADGGAWKSAAVREIARWLRAQTNGKYTIIA